MVVYKYKLDQFEDHYEALMPPNGKVLRIDIQDRNLFVWALVDPLDFKTLRQFAAYGTGHPIPDDGCERVFLNTFFSSGNEYVFHAFEVLNPA